MPRPIDAAMAADRPAKKTIRAKWIDKVQEKEPDLQIDNSPLYLTMPGAEGKEIDLLIRRGVLRRNDTGSIAAEDGLKVVAIEYDDDAQLALRKKYPGLSVR